MLASIRLGRRQLVIFLLLSVVLLIQSAQLVPLSTQSMLTASKSTNRSDSMVESATVTSTSTSNQSIPAGWRSWRAHIASIPAPQAGCFAAAYPSTVWQPTQCRTVPSSLRLLASAPSNVGNGHDEVAQSSGTLIGSSTGSFQSVVGLTSETDSSLGANAFSLQVNSQFFPGVSTTYTGQKSGYEHSWEQFVFTNDPSGSQIFIQYWLIGYQSTYGGCPSTPPPNGNGWYSYGNNCYANSPSTAVPAQAISNLANLALTGYANFAGSNDETLFCISGGNCYKVVITDGVVNLYKYWLDSEFNVFGYCCASTANFNSGTAITVANTLDDQSGNAIAPSCVVDGWTGETNNLNLEACSTNGGQILFTESNGPTQVLTTGVDAGQGTVSPSCPVGCGEPVGSMVSVTATPSSGWQFSSWSVTGSSCSGGSSSDPCTFTMPNNAVTVSATFIQPVTFNTEPASFPYASSPGSISACSGTFTNGQSSSACGSSFSATANLPSPSTGWQFDQWTWTGGVSCTSNTANPTSCTFTSQGSLTATFAALVTFTVSPASAVIGWGSCAGPNEANGDSIYATNFGPVTACYYPAGYSVSSWACSSGLSCAGSGDLTSVSFTGPGTITLTLKTGSLTNPVSTMLTASATQSGSSFTVSGTLTAAGSGVSGETIVLVFGWSTSIVTVTTASGGAYMYTATAPTSAGPYNVDAFFLGDYGATTQYLPSKATAMLTVT